jgi:hypothetical protein
MFKYYMSLLGSNIFVFIFYTIVHVSGYYFLCVSDSCLFSVLKYVTLHAFGILFWFYSAALLYMNSVILAN